MQEEGKRPPSQLHEQLSSLPAPPLSTSSLTTPSKKKKLLKVILKVPPSPNPNGLPPSPLSSSSPPSSSPSSLSTTQFIPSPPPPPPPHHHHQLQQQHQLHHHQQLRLQQQHLQKQRLLQQQAQQLASELQLKLLQQHRLQQEHPRILEQLKQELEQEQILAASLDLSQRQEGERGGFLLSASKEDEQRGNRNRILDPEEANLTKSDGIHLQSDGLHHSLSDAQCEPRSKRAKLSDPRLKGPLRGPNSQRNAGKEDQCCSTNASIPLKPLGSPIAPSNRIIQSIRVVPTSEVGGLSNSTGHAHILPAGKPTSDAHGNLPSAVPNARNVAARDGGLLRPTSEGAGIQKDGATKDPLSNVRGSSGHIPVPGRRALRGILDKLQKKDSFGAFSEPVDAKELPDYYDVIKDPMDFGTMRKRITAGYYATIELFKKDIFTICSNAMTFNAAGTIYHRQARAIKMAASRLLEALKSPGSTSPDEAPRKERTVVAAIKKSHKKQQPWTSDYVSQPLVTRTAGRPSARTRTFPAYPADSYYVDWQGVHTSRRRFSEEREDTPGLLAKSLGLYNRRSLEENRRDTYQSRSGGGSGSLLNTVCDGPLQLVPAAYQLEFSYARSLARFATDLGPDIWRVASEKIRRALPAGVAFGPGWVGERDDATSRPFPVPTKGQAEAYTYSRGKVENRDRSMLSDSTGVGYGKGEPLPPTQSGAASFFLGY